MIKGLARKSSEEIKSHWQVTTHLWFSGKEIRRLLPKMLVSKIIARGLRRSASTTVEEFEKIKKTLSLSTDWFTQNIPHWDYAFKKADLSSQNQISILEIGSWEGLSASFFLSYFPHATVDSVDTWEGGDEHKVFLSNFPDATVDSVDTWEGVDEHKGVETVLTTEQRFDQNTASFPHRVRKFKGTSDAFFLNSSGHEKYRVVYIDGSHRAEDVYNDSCNAFARLEVGGLLILDDLPWTFYDDILDNPAAGMNRFLESHAGQYRVVHVAYQLYLIKTK